MADPTFHKPTERELEFLRIVTRGYDAFERQIESCEISEYAADGHFDLRVTDPISRVLDSSWPLFGPTILPSGSSLNEHPIQILLYTAPGTDALTRIEIVSYEMDIVGDPCALFVAAALANPPKLTYAENRLTARREPRIQRHAAVHE